MKSQSESDSKSRANVCPWRSHRNVESFAFTYGSGEEEVWIFLPVVEIFGDCFVALVLFGHNLNINKQHEEGRKEMFYLTTHSTHFIYGYMASDIW